MRDEPSDVDRRSLDEHRNFSELGLRWQQKFGPGKSFQLTMPGSQR